MLARAHPSAALAQEAQQLDTRRARPRTLQITTEASIDVVGCDDLIEGMVAAGFDGVFVGIETPSKAALRETHKLQNLAVDLDQAIEELIRAGLDVTAGFIMGFDADDAEALARQREWVLRSPIPQAMIGVLIHARGGAAAPGGGHRRGTRRGVGLRNHTSARRRTAWPRTSRASRAFGRDDARKPGFATRPGPVRNVGPGDPQTG